MKRLIAFVCLLPALLFSLPVLSQSRPQAYIGAGLGLTEISEEENAQEVDDRVPAGMLYGGWRLSPYAALEVTYLRSGSFDYDVKDIRGRVVLETELDWQAWMVGFNLRQQFVDDFWLFWFLGVAFWEAEVDLGPIHIDDDSNDPAVGLGFEFHPGTSEEWLFRAQWLRVGTDSSDVYAETDVDTFLVGLHYQF